MLIRKNMIKTVKKQISCLKLYLSPIFLIQDLHGIIFGLYSDLFCRKRVPLRPIQAEIAQLVEQRIRNA